MKHFSIFLFIFLVLSGYSQTGPGGIGTVDGSSSLKIWLRADDINANGDTQDNPASGTAIDTWSDNSGNYNDFTQSGSARPTYNTGSNFNSVYYDPDEAQLMNGTITGSYSDGSVFFVINPIEDGTYNTLLNNGDYSLRIEQWSNTNKVGYTRYGVKDYKTNIDSPFGVDAIVSYHKSSSSSYFNVRVNNSVEWLNVQSTSAGIPLDQLGKISSGSNRTAGYFYEVLLYDQKLNTAEIIIMENYLSAKYNSIDILYDVYDEDDSANGDYDYDVAGIGRVDASNLHDDSQGTGIVRILNPDDLGDDEFLIWGHDNGILEAIETSDVPSPVQARFDRVWRASEANLSGTSVDVGSIDIRFDLSDLNSVTASDLRLLVDSDNDGVFADETPIAGATYVGGDVYEFTSIPDIADNLRFTLGTIDTNQTALPLELIDFDAKVINDNTVELTWRTASETNNGFFTVMRSDDLVTWENVSIVNSHVNSPDLFLYHAVDTNPYNGISYYRLKFTGLEGEYSYSKIRNVKINGNPHYINIYPNPATDRITVAGDESELESIKVYDAQGQDITTLVSVVKEGKGKVILDLSKLDNGIYYIKSKTTSNSIYKILRD